MEIFVRDHLKNISSPANLRINDQISAYRAECLKMGCDRDYHHFAFGQSPFSPPPTLVQAVAANSSKHAYLPTGGMAPLRDRIAQYYSNKFGIDCTGEQVVVGPGSKEMISIALTVLDGALIIPTPSWVSYLPQAKIIQKEVISLRTNRTDDYKLTPDLLIHGLGHVQSTRKILLLNHPHNPTGIVYTAEELTALAEVCRAEGVIVISDEIYAQTTFDMDSFTSMARVYPEGTLLTGGLSKDRSCGGYRFGLLIAPGQANDLTENILKVAGSTYSCVAAPFQYAAMEAYSGNDQVESHIRDCTKIHALAGRKTSALLSRIPGVRTTTPRGAFYLLVDFNEHKVHFRELGLNTCVEFCENLLSLEHTALLPGSALLLPEDDFSVRCSYVDYDGDAALRRWRANPPASREAENAFVEHNFPLITGGVGSIERYIRCIAAGKRPGHSDVPAACSLEGLH